MRRKPPIRHNNNYIPYTQDTKILGVTYENKLTYTKHINSKIPLARHAYSTLNGFQQFHSKIRLHLFKMYVLPILTFSCIPLLLNGFKSLKKIQIFQNKHIRHTHSIPWDYFILNITLYRDLNLHNENNLQNISQTLQKTQRPRTTHFLLTDSQLKTQKLISQPPQRLQLFIHFLILSNKI